MCICFKSLIKNKKKGEKKNIPADKQIENPTTEASLDDDEKNVEKDGSQTSSTSISQPQNIPSTTPPIILTTTEMTETEINVIDIDNTPTPSFEIPDNQESDKDDTENSRSIINIDDSLTTNISRVSASMIGSKAALKLFTTSLVAAKPFFPWIESVNAIISEIVNHYETVEYNKKTCLVLVERVESISLSVKTLTRRREENCEKFQNETYFHSFIRLHKVLKLVNEFINDISELKGYRKFLFATEVKTKANHLLNRLETCCNELQFSIVITQEMRMKEQKSFDDDVANMSKFLESIELGVSIVHAEGEKTSKMVNRIYEEVQVVNRLLSELKLPDGKAKYAHTLFNSPTINPNDLHNDLHSTKPEVKKGNINVYKKLLRGTIPVACKTIEIPDPNDQVDAKRIQGYLSILSNTQSSNKVIKFHGKSELNNKTVMVFDWAEHGNLKDLYEREPLDWVEKLRIAHDIATGLVFLQACDIFHHDIRCENILITGDARYEAKITNFDYSRELIGKSIKIKNYDTIIRWLAPEKIPEKIPENIKLPTRELELELEPYTFKCEIFSFGMLLWELGAQKFPYKEMVLNEITSYVRSEGRENFKDFNYTSNNGLEPCNDKGSDIAKGFIRIIESAWAHEHNQRPTINYIYQELDGLVESHSPRMRPSNHTLNEANSITIPENSNNNNSPPTSSNDEWEDDSSDNLKALEPILSLEEGIDAHKNGRRSDAWKCFEIHAMLGDPIAIHWKAYYYLKGYDVIKANAPEAIRLFKIAADANVPEAQYYYANALVKAKKPEFLDYFIKAADNDNTMAQRELGRIYYYGSNGIEMNKEKGIQYLKQAALKNNRNAIEDLKKINPKLID